jgi:hypothetical protein
MATGDIDRETVEKKINEAYAILQNKSQAEELPERLYSALEGICSIIVAHRKAKGASGWSKSLVDLDNKPLFTDEESSTLETAMDAFEKTQTGGADLSNIKRGPASDLVMPMPQINPEDISIDKVYHTIDSTLDKYNDQWREISGSLGIVKGIESQDYKGVAVIPFIPPIPIPYYILGKGILPFLNIVLELLRLAVSNTVWDMPTARVLLSVAVAVLDLLRGEWKNAVLTLLGTYSSKAAIVGFGLKLLHNAYLFLSPDLQKDLKSVVYRSTKSMTVGFLIWCFTCFAPDFVRFAAEASFEKLRTIVTEMNNKILLAQEQAQTVGTAAGIKVEFPKIPLEMIPSIDDIQNLQTLVKVPEVYCSPEVQDIMQPLLLIPPLRLVIELLNIPTVEEDVAATCKGVDTSSIEKSIIDMATPKVTPIPGGILDQAAQAAAKAEEVAAAVSNPTALLEKAANPKKLLAGRSRKQKSRK